MQREGAPSHGFHFCSLVNILARILTFWILGFDFFKSVYNSTTITRTSGGSGRKILRHRIEITLNVKPPLLRHCTIPLTSSETLSFSIALWWTVKYKGITLVSSLPILQGWTTIHGGIFRELSNCGWIQKSIFHGTKGQCIIELLLLLRYLSSNGPLQISF